MQQHYWEHYWPYVILREYIEVRGKCKDHHEPFFIFQGKIPIIPRHLRSTLKSMLTNVGVNPYFYNIYSFRSGRAIDLFKIHHFSVETIKKNWVAGPLTVSILT